MKNEEKKHLVNIQLDRAEVFVFGSLCVFTWFGILFFHIFYFQKEQPLQYGTILWIHLETKGIDWSLKKIFFIYSWHVHDGKPNWWYLLIQCSKNKRKIKKKV